MRRLLIGILFPAGLATPAVGQPSPDILPSAPPPAYHFRPAEQTLLDRIEHAAFRFFWYEVGDPAPLVKDRYKGPVSSVASVGFQLASLPIGVERGWITRAQGRQRAVRILHHLLDRRDNKKNGIYLHFVDLNTAGLSHEGYETVFSTVDTALLLSGAVVAASYFGGPVSALTDRMLDEADWRSYVTHEKDFICMGFRPDDPRRPLGSGKYLPWHWWIASAEERLIYFLAVGSRVPQHAIEPAVYYRLNRTVKRYKDLPPFVVSWNGCLFTYFFSQCYIDFRMLGPDDPSRFDIDAPRVDWFENSRRAILTHRRRCIEQSKRFHTLSAGRWGLSACAGRDGYIVPRILPNLANEDVWYEGTVAPYAAGSSIIFLPDGSLAALRAFYELRDETGRRLIWRDWSEGGYGFVDAFNLDQGYVSDDYIGIDQGPMLLAIENARSGLIWRLFMRHPAIQRALRRLKLVPRQPSRFEQPARERRPAGARRSRTKGH